MNEVPEPNPEQSNREPKKSNSTIYWNISALIGFLIIAALSIPVTISSHKNPNRTQAISNAKQISLALFEFESKYGSYPNDSTAELVAKNHPKYGRHLTGNSSNALFRQLLATGIAQSEEIFYAKTRNSKRPDGNITPEEALNKGEVGFAYFSNQTIAGNPSRILLITPIIPGTTQFDPKPFDGRAIILKIDGSVGILKIDSNGHAILGGEDILSPKHPTWNGKVPTIHYPE